MPLKISKELSLPDQAVTETIGILAVKRAGKSNAAVVMAEEMYRARLPWVAIDPKGDWWGVRSSGDGKGPGLSVLVFGGEHGDVPLEPTAGNLVADLVAEQRITCVLDVSEMTKADQRRFLKDFASRLYRVNREPLHVFCEEADEYIPQRVMGDMAALVGAFETLVKRGGFRGIGITLITQRSASLNKDVLTQIGTLITLRTTSPQDRKAILGWVEHHTGGAEAVDELPNLGNGEAFVYSPEWLKTLERIQFRRRSTYDSGATPAVGQRRRAPVTVADVDLAAIKEAMAETILRAEAADPKKLQARIRQLEKDLSTARANPPARGVTETVEVPIWPPNARAWVEDAIERADAVLRFLGQLQGNFANAPESVGPAPVPKRPAAAPSAPRAAAPQRPSQTRATAPPPAGDVKLGKAERAILTVLAQFPDGRTRQQLAMLSGYTYSGGFRNSLSLLRSAGYLVGGNQDTMAITDAGQAALGEWEPLPDDLRAYWTGRLSKAEGLALDCLIDIYPSRLDGPGLAAEIGYEYSGGFRNALSRLRTLELIEGTNSGGMAAAAELVELL